MSQTNVNPTNLQAEPDIQAGECHFNVRTAEADYISAVTGKAVDDVIEATSDPEIFTTIIRSTRSDTYKAPMANLPCKSEFSQSSRQVKFARLAKVSGTLRQSSLEDIQVDAQEGLTSDLVAVSVDNQPGAIAVGVEDVSNPPILQGVDQPTDQFETQPQNLPLTIPQFLVDSFAGDAKSVNNVNPNQLDRVEPADAAILQANQTPIDAVDPLVIQSEVLANEQFQDDVFTKQFARPFELNPARSEEIFEVAEHLQDPLVEDIPNLGILNGIEQVEPKVSPALPDQNENGLDRGQLNNADRVVIVHQVFQNALVQPANVLPLKPSVIDGYSDPASDTFEEPCEPLVSPYMYAGIMVEDQSIPQPPAIDGHSNPEVLLMAEDDEILQSTVAPHMLNPDDSEVEELGVPQVPPIIPDKISLDRQPPHDAGQIVNEPNGSPIMQEIYGFGAHSQLSVIANKDNPGLTDVNRPGQIQLIAPQPSLEVDGSNELGELTTRPLLPEINELARNAANPEQIRSPNDERIAADPLQAAYLRSTDFRRCQTRLTNVNVVLGLERNGDEDKLARSSQPCTSTLPSENSIAEPLISLQPISHAQGPLLTKVIRERVKPQIHLPPLTQLDQPNPNNSSQPNEWSLTLDASQHMILLPNEFCPKENLSEHLTGKLTEDHLTGADNQICTLSGATDKSVYQARRSRSDASSHFSIPSKPNINAQPPASQLSIVDPCISMAAHDCLSKKLPHNPFLQGASHSDNSGNDSKFRLEPLDREIDRLTCSLQDLQNRLESLEFRQYDRNSTASIFKRIKDFSGEPAADGTLVRYQDWRETFVIKCATKGIIGDDLANEVAQFLQGRAFKLYSNLTPQERKSWAIVDETLKDHLDPDDSYDAAQEYYALKMIPGQSVMEFLPELKRKHLRAFPNTPLDDEGTKYIIRKRLLTELPFNYQLYVATNHNLTRTLEGLVTFVRQMEKGHREIAHVSMGNDLQVQNSYATGVAYKFQTNAVTTTPVTLNPPTEIHPNPTSTFAKPTGNTNSQASPTGALTWQQGQRARVICYRCHKPGHYSNNCRSGTSRPNNYYGKMEDSQATVTDLTPSQTQPQQVATQQPFIQTTWYAPGYGPFCCRPLASYPQMFAQNIPPWPTHYAPPCNVQYASPLNTSELFDHNYGHTQILPNPPPVPLPLSRPNEVYYLQ